MLPAHNASFREIDFSLNLNPQYSSIQLGFVFSSLALSPSWKHSLVINFSAQRHSRSLGSQFVFAMRLQSSVKFVLSHFFAPCF